MSLPIMPAGSTYSQLMTGFFGDKTIDEQNALWREFLKEKGLTSNPAETPELLKADSEYIASVYTGQQAQALAEGDPRKKLIMSLYDILVTLIGHFVQTQITNETTVAFLTKYQKNYQELMAKGFFYKGGAPTASEDYNQTLATTPDAFYTVTEQTPSNIDTFDLGYGGLTVADCIEYLYKKAAGSPTGTNVQFALAYNDTTVRTAPTTVPRYMNFSVTNNGNNTFSMEIGATANGHYHSETGAVSVPTVDDYPAFKAKMQQMFQATYQDMQTYASTCVLFIPWEKNVLFNYTGKKQELIAKYGEVAKTRAARNQAIQSFLDASKSRKDIISDKQDQQQRIIDSASSARKQSSNILGAILQNLKSILASIYK